MDTFIFFLSKKISQLCKEKGSRRHIKQPDFMFITVQFPIVDYRYLQDDPLKLQRPNWPEPDPDEDRMLYFGRIFNRNIPYKGPWDDEKRYCNVKSVFNFCGTSGEQFRKSIQEPWWSSILFRRFQSDGKFLAKFEIGFDDEFEYKIQRQQLQGQQLKAAIYDHINHYLLCPVKIKIGSRFSDFVPLIHAGKHLTNAYFWSTHKGVGKRTFENKLSYNYVEKGEPIVIVHLDSAMLDLSSLPVKKLDVPQLSDHKIALYYDHVSHKYKENRNLLPTWFISIPYEISNRPMPAARQDDYESTIRYLRINLLRIHAEKIVLKKIVQKIGNNDDGFKLETIATSNKVLFHLHKLLFNLSKDTRNSLNQGTLVEMAFMLEELSNSSELEMQISGLKTVITLLEKLDERNKPLVTYANQIIQHMGDQITIGTINGNFINKSHLINSLNATESNGMDEETKQTLLAIAAKIEESQNQVAAVIFDQFNEELAKPKPEQSKSKLKQFWDGLVKVMPDVLTIGKSVAGIVGLF